MKTTCKMINVKMACIVIFLNRWRYLKDDMLQKQGGKEIFSQLESTGFLTAKSHKNLIKICGDILVATGEQSGFKK